MREALDEAGYAGSNVLGIIGDDAFSLLALQETAPILRRTVGGSPLETLIRLFIAGATVDVEAARRAFRPLTPEDWAAGGIVHLEGDGVRARVAVRPFNDGVDDLFVVSDWRRDEPMSADFVLGVGPASATLANLTIRHPVDSTLDLGTGGGIQAFYARHHSRHVVATDRSARAVGVALFNLELNGIDNVEVREGDLFDPVKGDQYDLIVSNPPFVISPERSYLFRDGGMEADEFCRTVVRGASRHLADGGFCQLLANWAHVAGEDWRERLAGWAEGTGCDMWVLQREVKEPNAYASSWLDIGDVDPSESTDRFNAWMDYYERARIEGIGFGLITIRRTTGAEGWFQADEITGNVTVGCGDHIAAIFDHRDFLESLPDDRALLDARLRASSNLRLVQEACLSGDAWEPEELVLRLEAGLRPVGTIDGIGATVVARCDGKRRLGEVLAGLGAGEDVAATALPIIRRLVAQGFLLPA